MAKSYKMQALKNGLKFSCQSAIRANKIKIIISFVLVLAAICAGIVVAIKAKNAYELGRLQDINLQNFYDGFVLSSSAFFLRCFSLFLNLGILTALAFAPKLSFLANILFAYRGYLFGLNFALIVIFYGIGSIFTAVVIVLPCQIFTLVFMILYFLVLTCINANARKYGYCETNKFLFILVGFLILFAINLAETLLLIFLNGKVIMVI